MLNPENRPLLGIYSDEGVGVQHGGPRFVGAMPNEHVRDSPSQPQQSSPGFSSSSGVPRHQQPGWNVGQPQAIVGGYNEVDAVDQSE